jgi:hypothetical protein
MAPRRERSILTDGKKDRVGLAGYGCLAALTAGGGLVGAGLIVLGIGAYVGAAGQRLDRADEAPAFADALERAVVLCGFGSLGLLVAVIAAVVLLKELGDDAARAARGPLRQGDRE